MTHSIGRDLRTRGKFQITGIDEGRGLIFLRHAHDGWVNPPLTTEEVPWSQFIRDLMDGHYEITQPQGSGSAR